MVGLGTQDTLDEAHEFVDEFGTESFTMLWDDSYQTWQEIGITSQPSAVLIDSDGTPINGWVGPFPEDDVLQLVAESNTAP